MKILVQKNIARIFRATCKKPLPDNIAIYFHSLEPQEYESFIECVEWFRSNGYSFCDPGSYYKQKQLKAENAKNVFLSFDDNHRNWLDASEIFDKLKIKVTFYVNTLPFRDRASKAEIENYFDRLKFSGARVTLSTDELKILFERGHTIGCHTHSHFNMKKICKSMWSIEIDNSKQILEKIVQNKIYDLSWPYGMKRFWSESLQQYCLKVGFNTIAAAAPGNQFTTGEHRLIHRTNWRLQNALIENLTNLRIDGRYFEAITGRSCIG